MAVRRFNIPAAYRPTPVPDAPTAPPPRRPVPPGGFRAPTSPAQADVALPDGDASPTQIKRLHACARDVGVDHAGLKAMAAALGYDGSLRDLPWLTWSRLMGRLQDEHGANVQPHERQPGDEFEGNPTLQARAFLAESSKHPVVKAVLAAFPNATVASAAVAEFTARHLEKADA